MASSRGLGAPVTPRAIASQADAAALLRIFNTPAGPNGRVEEYVRTIHQPVVDEMRHRGTPFHGCLYAGLMLTAEGPKVLEFNVRFGDPECQVLMLRLMSDLVPALLAGWPQPSRAGAPVARSGASGRRARGPAGDVPDVRDRVV